MRSWIGIMGKYMPPQSEDAMRIASRTCAPLLGSTRNASFSGRVLISIEPIMHFVAFVARHQLAPIRLHCSSHETTQTHSIPILLMSFGFYLLPTYYCIDCRCSLSTSNGNVRKLKIPCI